MVLLTVQVLSAAAFPAFYILLDDFETIFIRKIIFYCAFSIICKRSLAKSTHPNLKRNRKVKKISYKDPSANKNCGNFSFTQSHKKHQQSKSCMKVSSHFERTKFKTLSKKMFQVCNMNEV